MYWLPLLLLSKLPRGFTTFFLGVRRLRGSLQIDIIMKLGHFRQSRPFFLGPLDCLIFNRLLFVLPNKNIDHYPLYFWHKLSNPK